MARRKIPFSLAADLLVAQTEQFLENWCLAVEVGASELVDETEAALAMAAQRRGDAGGDIRGIA